MCLLLPVKNMNVLINPKTFNLSELALQYLLHPEDGSIKHQLPFKPKQEKKTEMLQTAHAFSFEFLTGPRLTLLRLISVILSEKKLQLVFGI